MKNTAVILATLATIIFFTGAVEAAEFEIDSGKNFVEQKRFTPPISVPRRNENPPQKFYPRRPPRPKPHYLPSKPSREIRGGGRGKFVPQAPFK